MLTRQAQIHYFGESYRRESSNNRAFLPRVDKAAYKSETTRNPFNSVGMGSADVTGGVAFHECVNR